MTEKAERSRVVEWDDPMIGASRVKEMTGLEYLQAMIAGSIPHHPS